MKPIIGLSGIAGAGKDTVADILVRERGFVKVSLADPMKRAVADWFGWDVERLWGPSDRRNAVDPAYNNLTARRALQFLGTEVGRELWRDVWVDYALRIARQLLDGEPTNPQVVYGYEPSGGLWIQDEFPIFRARGVVLPDIRFENELAALRVAGARVIRIKRASSGLTGSAAAHASETEQERIPDRVFDGVIYNDASIDDLRALALAIVDAHGGTS